MSDSRIHWRFCANETISIQRRFIKNIHAIAIAERILTGTLDISISVKLKDVLKVSQDFRGFVLRVETNLDSVHVPDTLIIKGLSGGGQGFGRECTGLEFLS